MNRYTKLKDGSWSVRVEGDDAPEPGSQLRVTRKDGTQKLETIAAVVWKSAKDKVYICSVKQNAPRYKHPGSGLKECGECGEVIRTPDQRCWETGGVCA